MNTNIIFIGAGGHCKVAYDAAQLFKCIGYVDNNINEFYGLEKIDEKDLIKYKKTSQLIISFGAVTLESLLKRNQVFSNYEQQNFSFANILHSKATISNTANLGTGILVAASSTLNPACRIGNNAIINTGAIIEHDAIIGNSTHVCPGAIVLGGAKVGENCLIGAGAVVLPNANVPDGHIIPSTSRFPK